VGGLSTATAPERHAIIKGRVCQQCNLPDNQVVFMPVSSTPPTRTTTPSPPPTATVTTTIEHNNNYNRVTTIIKQLDEKIRYSSAEYYSNLALAQERKLKLWRTRYYNNTNNNIGDKNTLFSAMRCARYAIKVGMLRELQGKTLCGSGGGSNNNNNKNGGNGSYQQQQHQLLWTDKAFINVGDETLY